MVSPAFSQCTQHFLRCCSILSVSKIYGKMSFIRLRRHYFYFCRHSVPIIMHSAHTHTHKYMHTPKTNNTAHQKRVDSYNALHFISFHLWFSFRRFLLLFSKWQLYSIRQSTSTSIVRALCLLIQYIESALNFQQPNSIWLYRIWKRNQFRLFILCRKIDKDRNSWAQQPKSFVLMLRNRWNWGRLIFAPCIFPFNSEMLCFRVLISLLSAEHWAWWNCD